MRCKNLLMVCTMVLGILFSGCTQKPDATSYHIYPISTFATDDKEELEIKDGRLVDDLQVLKQKANIKVPVTLKKFDSKDYIIYGNGNAGIEKNIENPDTYTIHVSKYYHDGVATEDAVRMMLAHELGHLKRGHCMLKKDRKLLPPKEQEKQETMADKFAIQLVGKQVFVKGLKEIEHYLYMGNDGDKRMFERLKMIKRSR